MGLKGLWQILQPSSISTSLDDLNSKTLAIDVNIWIYQLLRASGSQSKPGSSSSFAVEIFFHRLCKLLYANICPVMVFEGSAPFMKRKSLQSRALRLESDLARSKLLLKKIFGNLLLSLQSNNPAIETLENESLLKLESAPLNSSICSSITENHGSSSVPEIYPFSSEYDALSSVSKLKILERYKRRKYCKPSFFNCSTPSEESFSRSQIERVEFQGRVFKEITRLKDEASLRKILHSKSQRAELSSLNSPLTSEKSTLPVDIKIPTVLPSKDSNSAYMCFEAICSEPSPSPLKTKSIDSFEATPLGVPILTKNSSLFEDSPSSSANDSEQSEILDLTDVGELNPPSNAPAVQNKANTEGCVTMLDARKVYSSPEKMVESTLSKSLVDNFDYQGNLHSNESDTNCTSFNDLNTDHNDPDVEPTNGDPSIISSNLDVNSKDPTIEYKDQYIASDIANFSTERASESFAPLSADLLVEYNDLAKKTRKPSKSLAILLKKLSVLFGCTNIDSYEEAEAQCAWLATNGLVDGIVSDDSDTIIFCELLGPSSENEIIIIRNLFEKKNSSIECYNLCRIRSLLGIDSSIYLSLVQFLESDYSGGVSGLGPVTALELSALLKDCKYDTSKLPHIIHHLQDNHQDRISEFERFRPFLSKISVCACSSFPNQSIERAYRFPKVHKSVLNKKPCVNEMKINVHEICGFMLENLGWPHEKTMTYLAPVLKHRDQMQERRKCKTLRSFFRATKKISLKSKRMNAAINLLLKNKI
ncbi:DNA repair protein rad2 [Mitosporidium daphniae]|uniref:Putative DNA repair protein n=1 Tax=Mitosporidium daphniae TaxID=1485682 RepID=A0A098VMC3_9MICR|nr:putative DNA repair protein [Mitosporidium daphniae]KGG49919.1 putative DNA repair protein [Mitosporidium daphniae]|eukprot:XP_013236384.1 putative DNA repair protein [Mitosporidium daphniae]